MDVIGDFEIIRTSLMMGDIKDVMWKIRSAKKKAEEGFHVSHRKHYSEYAKLLDLLAAVLSGKGSLSDLRNAMKSDYMSESLQGADVERYTDTFLFYIEYAIDRYNVEFPEYDEKRCGDA